MTQSIQEPFFAKENVLVSAVHLSEEETESGPDWVRNMDLAESGHALVHSDWKFVSIGRFFRNPFNQMTARRKTVEFISIWVR